jgi:molecular chaperone DnaK
MSNTINFGIDLGTTNSVISKFEAGKVKLFKDMTSLKNTVPSAVFFREDRIIIGPKAKERYERDAANVYSTFKRKMGTSETYLVPATGDFVSPIELSAHVLKYLKTLADENVDAVIITIPASFDTIQSNATKEAGNQAGFEQVLLLQEPIAASLAFANQQEGEELKEGQWLVYDLGGGTFDVALVKIEDGEMRVIDHEGNNFLGGTDFDHQILEKIIIPKLEQAGTFANLEQEMKQATGKYNALYFRCLHEAEKAKIELSSSEKTEVEIQITDDKGQELDLLIPVTRAEFEQLIATQIDSTVEMITNIFSRNNIEANDLESIILVGGSTYIPYVREKLAKATKVPVDFTIDPTTAVAVGAAYYAGTKVKEVQKKSVQKSEAVELKVKMAYPKASQEAEEFFAAKFEGNVEGLFYRITRMDGGFDTGLKKLTPQIQEDLPLVENAHNFFKLTVYDAQNNEVPTNEELIGITQGKYSIEGQPLPSDICIEVDDFDHGGTTLDVIFKRNMVLPMRKTRIFPLNQTLQKGNPNQSIIINVVEGPSYAMPEACQTIGYIKITGQDLTKDVVKGSDLEITFKISESRDLEVSVYLGMSDQEFTEVFTPKERHTPVEELKAQVNTLHQKLTAELQEAEKREDYELAQELNNLLIEMDRVSNEVQIVQEKDMSDKRYQLEDRKRKAALKIDQVTRSKRLSRVKEEYEKVKEWGQWVVRRFANTSEQRAFQEIVEQESYFLESKSTAKIKEKTEEMRALVSQLYWRTPELLSRLYYDLSSHTNFASYSNPDLARNLIKQGQTALDQQNWGELANVNAGLLNMLPRNMANYFQGGRSVGF